jgi:hypothetical protein
METKRTQRGSHRRWIDEAQFLSLLVQLNKLLQDVYSIKPDRMQKFSADTKTLEKISLKVSMLKERQLLEMGIYFATCVPKSLMLTNVENSKLFCESQYKNLCDLTCGNFVGDDTCTVLQGGGVMRIILE